MWKHTYSFQGIFKISQNATLDNIANLRMPKHPHLPIQTFGDSNLQLGDNNKNLRTNGFSTIAAALRKGHLPQPLNMASCGKATVLLFLILVKDTLSFHEHRTNYTQDSQILLQSLHTELDIVNILLQGECKNIKE